MRRINVAAYEVQVEAGAKTGLFAAVLDLPGCVAAAANATQLQTELEQAIIIYLDDHPEMPSYYLT